MDKNKEKELKLSLKIKKITENNSNNIDNKESKEILFNSNNDKNDEIINDNSDNLDINSIKNKESYKSMFSIISKGSNDDIGKVDLNNSDISVIKKDVEVNRNNTNRSEKSQMSINSASSNNSNNTISIWEAIKLKISNIKNKIIFNYNIFSYPYNLNYTSSELAKEIQIFDEKFKQHEKLVN